MAVSPGQPVKASVVNSNFMSRVDANTDTVSIVALNNALPESGDAIPNLQAAVNGTKFVIYAEQSVTSGGFVNISLSQGSQYRRVSGNAGPIVTSSTPFGTGTFLAGTIVRLVGFSNTNTVSILNNDISKGAILNGNATLGLYDILDLQWDAVADRWIEIERNF